MKWFRFAVGSAIAVALAVFAAIEFGGLELRRLQTRIDSLEAERRRLVEYADKLSAVRRVAQAEVVEQLPQADGRVLSRVLWQEIADDGVVARPQTLDVYGEAIYFESMVLKFEPQRLQDARPATSLAMFRRVFGDQQSPQSGAELRQPPTGNSDDDVAAAQLWARFWEFVDDPALAARYGVRFAHLEAPGVPARVGDRWELSLSAAGGLNIRKIVR
ncbi:MAG: hypothetical protein U1D55_18200 [Phycisphaerae bacterium]